MEATLPITELNKTSKETGWDEHSKLIIACEFITDMDKTEEFKKYVNKKAKEEVN